MTSAKPRAPIPSGCTGRTDTCAGTNRALNPRPERPSLDPKGARMKNTIAEGGCACGAIRYRVSGPPSNTMICHCQTCRRVAASPVVAWLTFPIAQFQLVAGRPSVFHSSQPVRRTFCGACGTPLTYEHADSPDSVDITTCSLDSPGAFPPTHHSWLSHGMSWVRFGDGLPMFQERRNDKAVSS